MSAYQAYITIRCSRPSKWYFYPYLRMLRFSLGFCVMYEWGLSHTLLHFGMRIRTIASSLAGLRTNLAVDEDHDIFGRG